MNKHRILTLPEDDQLLRRKAKKVKDFRSTEVLFAIQTMKKLAAEWEQQNPGRRCEGLAATQIGIPLRILIVRGTDEQAPIKPVALDLPLDEERETYQARLEIYQDFIRNRPLFDPWVTMINPVFVTSDGMQDSVESCLSVPGLVGTVIRPDNVQFYYFTPKGKRVPAFDPDSRSALLAKGFSAACITHEMDHLNGFLFTDTATSIRKQTAEEESTL